MERLLIPKKSDGDGSFHVIKMTVDVDDESALLTFNFALCLERGEESFLILLNFNFNTTHY